MVVVLMGSCIFNPIGYNRSKQSDAKAKARTMSITIFEKKTKSISFNCAKDEVITVKIISGKKKVSYFWSVTNKEKNVKAELNIKGKKVGNAKLRLTNKKYKTQLVIKVKVKAATPRPTYTPTPRSTATIVPTPTPTTVGGRLKGLGYRYSEMTWNITKNCEDHLTPWIADSEGIYPVGIQIVYSDPNDTIYYEDFTWSSSNTSVATIGKDGIVYAKGEGTTFLTCSYENLSTSMKLNIVDVDGRFSGGSTATPTPTPTSAPRPTTASSPTPGSSNKCPSCNGVGKILCHTCSGAGYKICPMCIGGYRYDGGNRVICLYCGGTGKNECEECHGTRIYDCLTCHGTGKVR